MKQADNIFSREDVLVVLATAPAGLGHIRVTEALRSGLLDTVEVETLGLKDPTVQLLHRISSRNQGLRKVMEFVQNNPIAEERFTKAHRAYLKKRPQEAYEQMVEAIKRRRPKPKVVVVVSTHFGLAHQLVAVKERLVKELDICVVLAVIVTDDSPQKVWGVMGADFIFVPSRTTQDKLISYMEKVDDGMPEVIVTPYPLSPDYCEFLTEEEFDERKRQVKPKLKTKTKLVVPISGAAVQLKYFQDMLDVFCKSNEVEAIVVSRDSRYTEKFLSWCVEQPCVEVVAKEYDPEVVKAYERVYKNEVISVEVTKPSEQSFKTLLTPKQRAGAVMLFSDPVGRQEDDNLAFLSRHGLIPAEADKEILEHLFTTGESKEINKEFLDKASLWRGLVLPVEGRKAGKAILKLIETGVLVSMMDFAGFFEHSELSSYGVELLWARLAVGVKKKCKL